jgi:hypothetical protein
MSEYWYCLKHHRVEGTEGEPNKDRLGPYATEEEAAHALEKVQARNESWDNDPDWNDDAPPSSGSSAGSSSDPE